MVRVDLSLTLGFAPQGIVAVDVDQVCADLFVPWLGRYNKDYNDNLEAKDITSWEIAKYVKPECGDKILDYLAQSDLYDKVPVIDGALYGVEYLRESGYRVIFATACYLGTHDAKWSWLVRHGFLPKSNTQDDLVSLSDKTLIRADYMIDDRVKHIRGFLKAGGKRAFLFDAPHNQEEFVFERLLSWSEIGRYF